MNFDHLDNPVWYALTTQQQQFAIGTADVKRYQPNILPFVAFKTPASTNTLELEGSFYIVGALPPLPADWTIIRELTCVQMVLQTPVEAIANVSALNASHSKAMLDLINKVQPGFYLEDTRLAGDYYGIWQDDKLVSVGGERLRLNNFTEVSAIVTDPAYTGRKYAQQLITHICNTNLSKGNIPFLHVLHSNERAIRLYKFLGFTERRLISFWQLKKI